MYIKRQIEDTILNASKTFPVVLLTGPRQTGKSTVLKNLSEETRAYVTLDDPQIRFLARNSPELFFQRFQPPLLIDEIQYAPQLFPYIKMICDERQENGLFWMTGSQVFEMMRNVQESLAGRVCLLKLYGFSQAEKVGREALPFPPELEGLIELASSRVEGQDVDIFDSIWKGSMPRVFTQAEMDVEAYYASYMQTYLERDIRSITNIRNEGSFVKFVQLIAARTAQELNIASLSREIEVDAKTCRSWLDILLTTGLVIELPAFSGNLSDRLIKRPKIYFMDTGLACYLTGWQDARALEAGSFAGAIFETWVIAEILKSWWFNGKLPRFNYYRDKNQSEIDLIIQRNQKIYPFEIKKSSSASHIFRNFSEIRNMGQELGFGGVISLSPNLLPVGEYYWMIPAWML